jgi:hypothetical protein
LAAEDKQLHKVLLEYMLVNFLNLEDITWAHNGEQARQYLEETLEN